MNTGNVGPSGGQINRFLDADNESNDSSSPDGKPWCYFESKTGPGEVVERKGKGNDLRSAVVIVHSPIQGTAQFT